MAQIVRSDGVRDPVLPLHAAAGRGGLHQHRLRALGPGRRMVQQRRLEHRAPHSQVSSTAGNEPPLSLRLHNQGECCYHFHISSLIN